MYKLFSLKVTGKMGNVLFVIMYCIVKQSLEVSEKCG